MGTKVNIVVKISTVLNKTSTLSRPTCFLQRSLKRKALGCIRKRKTVENHPKPQNCKKFSHPSYQNSHPSITVSNKWSIYKFRSYSRSVEAQNRRSDRRETGTQRAKAENYIGYQTGKPISVFYDYRKPKA